MENEKETVSFFSSITWYNKLIIILGFFIILLLCIVAWAEAQILYSDIEIMENQESALTDKYFYIPKSVIGGLEVEVHEYVTPDRKAGYQIFDYTNNKSIGYGAEAAARTYIINKELAATSTEPRL